LQTALPLLLQAGLTPAEIADKLSLAPRKILKLDLPAIQENTEANFCVYSTKESWTYDAASNLSKSSNSPLLKQTLTGKVKLVYNNNQFRIYG